MARNSKTPVSGPRHSAGTHAGEQLPMIFAMQCNMRWGKRRLPVTISLGSRHPLLGLFELVPRSIAAAAILRSASALVSGRVVSFEWCGMQFSARIAGRSKYLGVCVYAADVLLAVRQAMHKDDASSNYGRSAEGITFLSRD